MPWLGLGRCAEAANNRPGDPPRRDALDRKRDADIPGEGIQALVSMKNSRAAALPQHVSHQSNFQQKGSTSLKSTFFPVIL